MTSMVSSTTTGHIPIYFYLAVAASILGVASFWDDAAGLICAMLLLWLGAGFSVRWDPLHPFTLFGTGLVLYSVAAPLLEIFDLYQHAMADPAATLRMLYVAMVFTLLAIGPSRLPPKRERLSAIEDYLLGGRIVVAIFLPVCALSAIYPFMAGIVTKQAIVTDAGIAGRLSYYSALNVGVSVFLLHAIATGNWKRFWSVATVFGLFYLLVIGLVGQRTGIYYLFLAALAMVAVFRPIRLKHLAIMGGVALGLNTIFAGLKMFIPALLAGEDVVGSTLEYYIFDERNYWLAYEGFWSRTFKTALLALLGSEPTTTAGNMDELLQLVPAMYPFQYGSAILGDITRSVSFGFLQEAGQATNSSMLFNAWVQLEGLLEGAGVGFCLVCTGYMDFGPIGVILLGVVVGLAMRLAYRAGTSSPLGLIFYANLVPIALTSLRQDFSQILSTPLKQLALPLLLIWAIRALSGTSISSHPTPKH